MPIEANYKTYYAIHLNHYSTCWAGYTYNKILVTEYPDLNLVSTSTTESSNARFIYPRLITNKCYLDGVAEGHITLYNYSTSTATSCTAFSVSLIKTADVPSSEETLGSYTCSISSDNSVATTGYLTLPFYMSISKQVLNENEKLILSVSHTSGSSVCISHALDNEDIDIRIKVPFAPET